MSINTFCRRQRRESGNLFLAKLKKDCRFLPAWKMFPSGPDSGGLSVYFPCDGISDGATAVPPFSQYTLNFMEIFLKI